MSVIGNFALNGDLNLGLGAPSLDPIITVGANLTLDGRLNVTDAGGFGDGVYRLFNYGGTLTDNGLALGALPGGANGNLQTAIAGQVNLVVGGAGPDLSIQFWDGTDTAPDGTVDGGAGTWNRVRPTGRAPTAASTPLGPAISPFPECGRRGHGRKRAGRHRHAVRGQRLPAGCGRERLDPAQCGRDPGARRSQHHRRARFAAGRHGRARSSATPAPSSSPASTPIRAGP